MGERELLCPCRRLGGMDRKAVCVPGMIIVTLACKYAYLRTNGQLGRWKALPTPGRCGMPSRVKAAVMQPGDGNDRYGRTPETTRLPLLQRLLPSCSTQDACSVNRRVRGLYGRWWERAEVDFGVQLSLLDYAVCFLVISAWIVSIILSTVSTFASPEFSSNTTLGRCVCWLIAISWYGI